VVAQPAPTRQARITIFKEKYVRGRLKIRGGRWKL
jgi:hypothetical protein